MAKKIHWKYFFYIFLIVCFRYLRINGCSTGIKVAVVINPKLIISTIVSELLYEIVLSYSKAKIQMIGNPHRIPITKKIWNRVLHENNLNLSFPSFSFTTIKQIECRKWRNFDPEVAESFSSNGYTFLFKACITNTNSCNLGFK